MASILDTLIPTYAFDSVGVFDQNFNQVFPEARAIKAVVKEQARVMQHPLETGAVTTDHRVILPIEIELSMILTPDTYQDVYRAIKQFYLNATLLVVQTKSSTYNNMLISEMPHEEDPETYNILALALSLKEVQFATTTFAYAPKDPLNSTTVNKGTQQGTVATTPPIDQSGAKALFNS